MSYLINQERLPERPLLLFFAKKVGGETQVGKHWSTLWDIIIKKKSKRRYTSLFSDIFTPEDQYVDSRISENRYLTL